MEKSGMSKYVINTVEVTKRVYLVEAYSQSEALDKNIITGAEYDTLKQIIMINVVEFPKMIDKLDD